MTWRRHFETESLTIATITDPTECPLVAESGLSIS